MTVPVVDELKLTRRQSHALPLNMEPYPPGIYEDERGWTWLAQTGTVTLLGPELRGGLASVRTDANGQATIVYPEPLAQAPGAMILTVRNQIVLAGVLELFANKVTVFVWDVFSGTYAANRTVDLYWAAVL